MQGPFLRKYGVQTTFNFQLFEIDGIDFKVDAAHVAGDTKIMKDEGVDTGNTSNGFTDEGTGYSIVLTATEMQAARIVVYVVDQGTKAWLDSAIVIETYGHASAMHAMDFDTTVPTVAEIQAEMEQNGASILDTLQDRVIGTLAAGTHNAQTGDSFARIGVAGAGLSNIDLPNQTMNITGNLSGSVGSVTGHTPQTADHTAILSAIAGYIDTEIAAIITHLTEIKGVGWVDENLTTIDGLIDTLITRIPSAVALASVCTEARLAELAAANLPTDVNDVQSRLPAALVTGRMSSDAVAISGSTDAADNLEASAETIKIGAAITGTLSTTQMTTNLTEITDDHYNGRTLIWTSGVLFQQGTDISGYNGTSKMLTFTAITEAPSNGDTFVIV